MLKDRVRPINSSIDRSVDILSEAPGVIECADVNLDFVSVAGRRSLEGRGNNP